MKNLYEFSSDITGIDSVKLIKSSFFFNFLGWIHTGDKVYYTEEGEIIISDRIKDVMKFRGHPVSPNELEECILKHPAVMEAVVVPVPHDLDLERPMAFVKKVPGYQVSSKIF